MYDAICEGQRRELPWLLIDDSILGPKTAVSRRTWDSHDHILCKIGMTTKSHVSARLVEWENTCKHPVVNLTPERVQELQRTDTDTLSRLLSRLSISHKQKKPLNLSTYREGGFWVTATGSHSLPAVENAIHRHLWARLGQGLIYCHGCDPNGLKRHKEWFKVPIAQLPWLLHTVDAFCRGSTN